MAEKDGDTMDHSPNDANPIGLTGLTRAELKAVKANFAQSLGLDVEAFGGVPDEDDLESGMRKMALTLLVLANNAETKRGGLPPRNGSRDAIPVRSNGSEAVRKLHEAFGDAEDIAALATPSNTTKFISVATDFTSRG